MARFPEKDGRESGSPLALLVLLLLLFFVGCDCSEVHIEGDVTSDSPGPRCPEGMAYIPAGDFVMGCENIYGSPPNCYPEHIVTMSAYCIDIVPVTNALWIECVEAGECEEPWSHSSFMREDYYGNPTYDNYPVIHEDWDQVQAYCQRLGKNLPTEAQWEKAARGGCELGGDPNTCDDPEDERLYPWGDEPPSCDRLVFCPSECCDVDDSREVGLYPLAASPYGVLDMIGNYIELSHDFYEIDYYSTGGPPWVDPTGPAEGTYHSCRGSIRALDPLASRALNNHGAVRCASAPYY